MGIYSMAQLLVHDRIANPAISIRDNRLRAANFSYEIPMKNIFHRLSITKKQLNFLEFTYEGVYFHLNQYHTCNLPSKLLGIVTHFDSWPGQLKAFSRS